MKTLNELQQALPFTGDNPFPGLRPFENDEAYLFFGRETQVDELLRRLRTERFIAVVGTSGSGKSSLIKAGLFSALRIGGMSGAGSRWRIATMRPGNDPIGELAVKLESAGLLGSDGDAELRVDLAYAILERGALGLVEIVRQMPLRPDENVLIVVDQFEELFRYAQGEEDTAAAFVRLLLEATAHPDLRLYVVLTMRSDFLGDCAGFTSLPERINRGLYLVPRMTREQLEAAIVGPVRVAGAEIAPRLVNRLLNDVGDDPDQLPVLAHALMLTYDLRAADHEPVEPIDERHYSATGGLAQAIDAHAERIFAALTPSQQAVAEKLFAAITELGPDNRGIRRPLELAELFAVCDADAADVRAVVDAYRARTCSFLRPPPDVPLTPHTIIDISHEALMRGWQRLGRLSGEEVDAARTYARLSDAAQMYGSSRGALLVDPALALNLEWRDRFHPTAAWAKRYGGDFTAAMDYIERSAEEKARRRAANRAAARRRWATAGGVMVVLLLLTFASIASFLSAQSERSQALVAQSDFIARDANAQIEKGNAVTGILLAQEALPLSLSRPDRPFVPAAAFALENGLNDAREIHSLQTGGAPYALAYSPDGKRIAASMPDGTVRVYDAASDALLLTLQPGGVIYYVAYSPDGRRIVTASSDKTARIFDASTGTSLRVFRGHSEAVTNAVFSPNGKFVLTASSDHTARIWRAAAGTLVRVLRSPNVVGDAEYSPDGARIVTAGSGVADHTARIWNAATGAPIAVLRGHTDALGVAIYSPDGTRIATTSVDKTAIIWDAKRGTILQILRGHTATLFGAGFSPDGTSLVTASQDGSARIWDVASGVENATLGEDGAVNDAIYSRDGSRIITSSGDGTIRTWLAAPPHLERILTGHDGFSLDAEYSPDGARIVSSSRAGIATVWNALTGAPLLKLNANAKATAQFSPDGKYLLMPAFKQRVRIWNATTGAPVRSLATKGAVFTAHYSPSGKLIAAAGVDGAAHLFDAATGAHIRDFRGHEDAIDRLAFSPDGGRLATGSRDTTGRVWDIASGKTTAILHGHSAAVLGIAFSPDGKRVVTGSADGSLRVWDATTGTSLLRVRPNLGMIENVAFSPDGRDIAAAMRDDKTVRIFDAASGAQLAVMRGSRAGVTSFGFAPDGRHLVSTSMDATLQIWNVPPRLDCRALLDAARNVTTRRLTEAERKAEFLSDRAPAPLFNPFATSGPCR